MSEIKPIETIHSGWKFRSRLEAKWGVFLETLGIEYIYEKEGFDLDGLWYLPDFFLPQYNCWIEIKPVTPTPEEREKAIRLAIASHQAVVMFVGDMWTDVQGWIYRGVDRLTRDEVDEIYSGSEECKVYWTTTEECVCLDTQMKITGINLQRQFFWTLTGWLECQRCGAIDVGAKSTCTCNTLEYLRSETPRLISAYTSARQARFGKEGRG